MEVERGLGFEPVDREFERLGYDIESRVPGTGRLRFIEVKGRAKRRGQCDGNQQRDPHRPQQAGGLHPRHRRVPGGGCTHRVHYLRQPFQREPDFGVTSVNYKLERVDRPVWGAGVSERTPISGGTFNYGAEARAPQREGQ